MNEEEIKEFVFKVLKDVEEIANCKYSMVDKCMLVSSLPPDQWPIEVLWPQRKTGTLIFGDNQVAMDRETSIKLLDALIWTNLCDSLGDARKAIRGGGVRVNRKVTKDINAILTKSDTLPNIDAIVLEFGKYNFGIIELC